MPVASGQRRHFACLGVPGSIKRLFEREIPNSCDFLSSDSAFEINYDPFLIRSRLLLTVDARVADQRSHGGVMNFESSARRNTIAVMNTKGGVGKSTIVLALAETLSAFHGKNVLIVDSDSQASASAMLMTTNSLFKLQKDGATIVDYLVKTVLHEETVEWPKFVVRDVSDVDDARSVYLIPSDMELTLLERKISEADRHGMLRSVIRDLLDQVRKVFDIVLIDCPPGLSILTESWLREADFHLSPTKPDYVSVCGLEVFRRFKALNPEMGFAQNIGVLVNMKDRMSPSDEDYTNWLRSNAENRCFEQPLPRINALQDAARFSQLQRSYQAKYPGEAGHAVRALAAEVLTRMAASDQEHGDDTPQQRAAAG
jgi:chromosome partitioning protein